MSPSLMWIANRGPLDLKFSDQEALIRHRMCLSAGLIMRNSYFQGAGFAPSCDAHCEGYFHRFSSDAEHVSIYKRRRDGYDLDGWPLDRVRITVPLSASPASMHSVDPTLLNGLVAALAGGTDLGGLLERSLPSFLQGNRLSEANTLLDDLVWMGAAFERLFDVREDVGRQLSIRVAELFSGVTQGSTNWDHISRRGVRQPESGPWCKRWMREFYDRRSVLHSGTGVAGTWADFLHALIASEVFSLATFSRLDEEGVRPLEDRDRERLDALDARIEALSANPADLGAAWRQPLEDSKRRAVVTAMTESLRKGET
jgi:hypothetical protein